MFVRIALPPAKQFGADTGGDLVPLGPPPAYRGPSGAGNSLTCDPHRQRVAARPPPPFLGKGQLRAPVPWQRPPLSTATLSDEFIDLIEPGSLPSGDPWTPRPPDVYGILRPPSVVAPEPPSSRPARISQKPTLRSAASRSDCVLYPRSRHISHAVPHPSSVSRLPIGGLSGNGLLTEPSPVDSARRDPC